MIEAAHIKRSCLLKSLVRWSWHSCTKCSAQDLLPFWELWESPIQPKYWEPISEEQPGLAWKVCVFCEWKMQIAAKEGVLFPSGFLCSFLPDLSSGEWWHLGQNHPYLLRQSAALLCLTNASGHDHLDSWKMFSHIFRFSLRSEEGRPRIQGNSTYRGSVDWIQPTNYLIQIPDENIHQVLRREG